MDKIAIEQNTQGSTYRQTPSTAEKAMATLGGFAVSFEELLQRVGAKIDNAFSAADKSHGLVASPDKAAEPAPRDNDNRGSNDLRSERSDNRSTGDDDRQAGATERGRGDNDGSNTDMRDDGASNRTERADSGHQDDASARDGKADATSSDNSGADDQSANGNATNENGSDNGQNNQAGNGNNGQSADAGANAQQGGNAAAAAAMQVAGVIGTSASENAKSGDTQQGQQAAAVAETQQAVNPGAVAKAQQQYGNAAKNQKNNTHQANGKVDVTAGKTDQAATKGAEGPATDAVKDQAQKLAQVIGKDNKAQVTVTVEDEGAKLTSKPSLTLTATTGTGKDDGAQTATARQQAGAQVQNNGAQNAQQVQAAALQQAQAQQQANGPQGAGASAGTGTDAASGIRAAGGAAHGAGTDATNNTQLSNGAQQTQQAAQSKESSAAQQAQQAQRTNLPGGSVVDQISVKITKALQNGTDRISIQLKPAELGRVDVKMEMTHDGRVMTVVTAEKQETLDLMRRDQSELQRALADAGLDSGDMEFNLQGQEQQTAENEGKTSDGRSGREEAVDADGDDQSAPEDPVLSAWESGIYLNGRLDVRA